MLKLIKTLGFGLHELIKLGAGLRAWILYDPVSGCSEAGRRAAGLSSRQGMDSLYEKRFPMVARYSSAYGNITITVTYGYCMLLHNMYICNDLHLLCVLCFPHVHLSRHMTKAHDKGTWQRHMTKAHDKHTLPHRWLHKMTWTTFVFFTTWLRRTTTMPWWCQIEELLRWEKKQRQSLGCDPDRYGRKTLWNEAWTLWRFGKGIQTMCCTQCPGGVMAEVLWLGSDEFSEMSDVEWWQMLMTNVDKGQEVTKEYSKTSLGQNLRRLGSQGGCWSC